MGKYHEFLEAYQKAYPLVRKQLMYEQANKLWKDLKLDSHLWEEKYKMKMSELKLLAIKNHGQNLKSFTQTKLSFGKAKVTAKVIDSPTENVNSEEPQLPNENGKSNSGRFYRKVVVFSMRQMSIVKCYIFVLFVNITELHSFVELQLYVLSLNWFNLKLFLIT